MSEVVVVYTQPGCGPCQGVKATLRRHKIIFSEVNIQADAEAYDYLVRSGAKGTPALRHGDTLLTDAEAIIMWAKQNSKRSE